MTTFVIDAIKKGNIDHVKTWIHEGGDPNFEYQHKSLLLMCILENKLDIAKFLIQIGANTTRPLRFGITPLNHAITKRNLGMVQLLVENGADLTMCRGLIHAIDTNNLEIVAELIKRGADVNRPNGKFTDQELPIVCAIRRNNPEMLKLLLENGADVSSIEPHANRLFFKCADIWNISEEILNFLLENGATVNCFDSKGNTPISRAVRTMNFVMTEYLIRRGAELNESNLTNETPLSIALANVDLRTVRLLIESGADPKLAWEPILRMATRDIDFEMLMVNLDKAMSTESPQPGGSSEREAEPEAAKE